MTDTTPEILLADDPLLKQVSEPVEEVNDEVRDIISLMDGAMRRHQGQGISAVQIGVLKRIIVMLNVTDGSSIVLINPKVVETSGVQRLSKERCLSLPPSTPSIGVMRSEWIGVEYMDENGYKQCNKFSQGYAVCLAHELDHLDGKTLLDHAKPVIKKQTMRKLKQIRKYNE